MGNLSNVLVSVKMITYKHERFIYQAITSVLNQQTSFEYEIIISDDCSPDSTKLIIEDLISNHPSGYRIKYFRHSQNIGALANFVFAMNKCESKYIAVCEADDFWSDQLKLQKQIELLESNPDLSGCFHNSEERYWNDFSKPSYLYLSNRFNGGLKTFDDFAHQNIAPTASIVFRNNQNKEISSKLFQTLPIGDWPLHLLNLREGSYYYISHTMSVRHLFPESLWGLREQISNIKQIINAYQLLINSGWFNPDQLDSLRSGYSMMRRQLTKERLRNLIRR